MLTGFSATLNDYARQTAERGLGLREIDKANMQKQNEKTNQRACFAVAVVEGEVGTTFLYLLNKNSLMKLQRCVAHLRANPGAQTSSD